MSDEIQTRRDIALDFLDELDGRHDLLLTELEQLSNRIDLVLIEYTKSRQSAALANGIAIDRSVAGSAQGDASESHCEAVDSD